EPDLSVASREWRRLERVAGADAETRGGSTNRRARRAALHDLQCCLIERYTLCGLNRVRSGKDESHIGADCSSSRTRSPKKMEAPYRCSIFLEKRRSRTARWIESWTLFAPSPAK